MGNRAVFWVALVGAVTAVEVAIATSRRVERAAPLWRGELTDESVGALLALLWLPVVVGVCVLAARRLDLLTLARHVDGQVLRASGATSRDWVWTSDPHLVITDSNERVEELLGWSVADVVGHPTQDFLVPGENPLLEPAVARGLETRTGWADVASRWRHKDGHVVELLGSASCILDRQGQVVALRGSRRPVDETASQRSRTTRVRQTVRRTLVLEHVRMAGQPIVSVSSGAVVGVEALARFPDDRPPPAWFSDAAQVGLGVDLELLAIRRALTLAEQLPYGYLSVNASPEAILDPRTADLLTSSPFPMGRVVLEVTEHVEVCRYDDLIAALAPLRAGGLRLAVDDAGAGFASFQHVLRLRPDIIKLDRTLIAGIEADPGKRAFVTAVVLVALELGASVTAEGVETAAELSTVTDLGVDAAQGYLLGRPSFDPHAWTATATAVG